MQGAGKILDMPRGDVIGFATSANRVLAQPATVDSDTLKIWIGIVIEDSILDSNSGLV